MPPFSIPLDKTLAPPKLLFEHTTLRYTDGVEEMMVTGSSGL